MPDLPASAGRFEPLPTLPIFFKLRGRRALIAGGGEPAVWKAEVLCRAGAAVTVVAETPCEALEELAVLLGPAALTLVRRPWTNADLEGVALALGAIEERDEAGRFREAAHRAGVPVNVIDKPDYCDFQFGTIVSRGPLMLGITTDGAAPVFGQAIRARIEAILPQELRRWAELARLWRPAVQARDWGFRRRRKFWELFADRALAATDEAPAADQLEAFLVEAEREVDTAGRVTLIGSGPGQPDSITLAAVRALQSVDILVYDADIPASLVDLARREAGKRRVETDAEGGQEAAALASQGRRVGWLGTGNPQLCPRWQRRALTLSQAKIAVTGIEAVSRCPHCTGFCRGEDARSGAAAASSR